MFQLHTIRQRLTTGAAVTALALVAASGLVGGGAPSAHAEPKRDPNAVHCVYYNPETGEIEFYLPGDYIPVLGADGLYHALYCGLDGNWHRASRTTQTASPLAPRPGLTSR